LYGIDYDNPISKEDVLEIFEQHGITGNPLLQLDNNGEKPDVLLKVGAAIVNAESQVISQQVTKELELIQVHRPSRKTRRTSA